ncbi:hypothetical protein U3516DRAFT_736451 [Neocallimastix sp. 'constans']
MISMILGFGSPSLQEFPGDPDGGFNKDFNEPNDSPGGFGSLLNDDDYIENEDGSILNIQKVQNRSLVEEALAIDYTWYQ